MAFCPEHPKWDQNPKFIPLSETTSIPATPFICGVPPLLGLPSSGKIQTWFTCTLAIWIPSSTLQYLLCNSYGWMWSSANSFLSVLRCRGVSICYRPTGEFWINSTAWDFHSLYRLWRKFKRKLSFLFVGKGKLFIMKLFFEEFKLICFTVERLTCFEMQPRQRRFGEFWGTFFTLWWRKLLF